jgi:hypothetical protein
VGSWKNYFTIFLRKDNAKCTVISRLEQEEQLFSLFGHPGILCSEENN